jgi:hypothetical protein
MSYYLRHILLVSLLGCLVAVGVGTVRQPAGKVASDFLEVRLRKIHIVRPDLIPYPISYEIDC